MSNFSLKELRDQMDLWRSQTPSYRSEVIPTSILKEAIRVIPNSSTSYVAKRLGIQSTVLASKIKQFESKESDEVSFIEVTPTETKKIEPSCQTRSCIEYISRSGTQINFFLPGLNAQTVSTILKDRVQ